MPYNGMKQIFDGSREVNKLPEIGSFRLPLWWGTWVTGGILDRISLRISGGWTGNADLSMHIVSAYMSAIAWGLLALSAFIVTGLLKDIYQLQEKRMSMGRALSA